METKKEITKEEAINLYNSNFWEKMTPKEIAEFQINTPRMCMPFDVFHQAVGKALDRPVWNHELFLYKDGIIEELRGERPAPSFEDIINLIPKEKRIMIIVEDKK